MFLNATLFSQEKSNLFDGEYQIRPGFNIAISTEGDGLFVEATDKQKEKLIPVSESIFKVESINGAIDFSQLTGREVVVVNMYGQILHAPRLPIKTEKEVWEELEVGEDEIKPFVGEYELTSQAKLNVSIENGSLFVQLTGQPSFPAYLYAENKFFYKVVKASLEFINDEDGKVKYLLLRQNGMIMQANKL